MLMAALFADAMGRDFMPEMYPQPPERAPALYVRLFLCAIGVRPPAGRSEARAATVPEAPSPARRDRTPQRRTTPPTKKR